MELKKAITQVVRFCDKSSATLRGVRLLPSSDDVPSRLYAFNGRCGIIVSVDEALPNTWVAQSVLSKVARGKGSVAIKSGAHGSVEFSGTGYNYTVHCEIDLAEFPGIPTIPKPFVPIDMLPTLQVAHASSGEEDKPHLRALNFTDNWVEATDQNRLARAYTSTGIRGLVPSELFKFWPKRVPCGVFANESGVFFELGSDHIRFAPFIVGQFPDTTEFIPDNPDGCAVVVATDSLEDVVSRATAVSVAPAINIGIEVSKLFVSAWMEDTQRTYKAAVPAIGKGAHSMLVNGKSLVQALKAVNTPNVFVRFTDNELAPLQLESAGYVECLWPMMGAP